MRPSGKLIRARYQRMGALCERCGSEASKGAPEALRPAPTAQALEAISGKGASSGKRGKCWASAPNAAPFRPSPCSAPLSFASLCISGSSGRPAVVSSGHKSPSCSGESRSASRARSNSMRQLPPSQSPMILPQSRLSTGCQGSGAPSAMNSGAAKRPRDAIQAFTPRA